MLLLLVDVCAYLWFRIAYQPWFTRRRTAYWTFQRPAWRSGKSSSKASSTASSPVLGRSTALPDPTPVTQRAPADAPEAPEPPRRNRSWIHARARSVGVDGPLFGFEQMRSPSPELAPLPSDEEGSDEREDASGLHTSDEWVRAEKNGD